MHAAVSILHAIYCRIATSSENASLAAFVGTFGGFTLVVLTDWRRRRARALKTLPAQVASVGLLASEAHNVLQQVLAAPPGGATTQTSYLRLPLVGLQELAAEVNDHLTDRQRVNVQSVYFLADTLNRKVAEVEALERTHAPAPAILDEVRMARDTARILVETCEKYPKTPWLRRLGIDRGAG
jgi:hypothetical protein